MSKRRKSRKPRKSSKKKRRRSRKQKKGGSFFGKIKSWAKKVPGLAKKIASNQHVKKIFKDVIVPAIDKKISKVKINPGVKNALNELGVQHNAKTLGFHQAADLLGKKTGEGLKRLMRQRKSGKY